MFDFLDNYNSYLYVGLGAAPGSIIRMHIVRLFMVKRKSSFQGILLVNLVATFFLGFFVGLQNIRSSFSINHPIFLLICIGFLGSLSTFSALIFDFYSCITNQNWNNLFLRLFCSTFLGIVAAAIGYNLVNI
ncbi:fluoride efflux transporter FluC [Prochlorococcus marinus]|uniref:fluoride efflux transporter FluC n=1 Tax=Prochlorococcus marinus TaxID=1219 RepID=UPI0022B542E9|nr:CrcB family protein [Prochlorococcus marinus]